MDIAVIGNSEFTLGFRLTGISHIIENDTDESVGALLNDSLIGVAIISQQSFDGLGEHMQELVNSSIKPVFVVLSTKPQEELRKMIIKSIGVDLLRDDAPDGQQNS